ncbi:hypothetical protein TWF225_003969 [Orbilia oligospora]|uniref:Uncharacterized protein n=1 Tax=Orbilia oligospora TaxID=2813651 RepID=A0A7C8PEK8_ORBOL|nr:hypothetical protein TWF751_004726 [Orbilia oligospora]KAF3160066.1 hypothetical protein TWF225_003969 [Orbilia oligospora]KAF3231385.1 hypothetical protein TWF128_004934 [Orbilia oligospora]KAF3248719.1 hypothetical protein TWF217_009072 [Orbilia oligospora]KAF3274981.1 hypothetical protein TWF132_003035 [Orbilia oligospora]
MSSRQEIINAATELSKTLTKVGVAHAIIGGAAVNMLGSERITKDVDILAEPQALRHREQLLRNSNRFSISNLQLVYTSESGVVIPIEILEEGSKSFIRMPELANIPILKIEKIPVVHPAMLVCMKLSRWGWMSDSTRPQSLAKADTDFQDIVSMLELLAESGERIDFRGIDEDRIGGHMEYFRKLRSKSKRVDQLLKIVLD